MPFVDKTSGQFLVPGPVGASEYQSWLGEGNVGTVRDFLASKKGEKGDPSTIPGPIGPQGVAGAGTIVTAVRGGTIAPSTYVVQLPDKTIATADPTNASHQGLVIGLDVAGGALGSMAQINAIGPVTGVSGTFGNGDPIWIGDGTTGRLGSPVNIPPQPSSTKDIWRQQVGTAATSSTINGLLSLAYLIRASSTPALVGPGSYVSTTVFGKSLVQAIDPATGRQVLGAAASGTNSDISGLSAVTGNVFVRSSPGAVPAQDLDFGASDYANIRHCVYQGSPSSPYSQDAYVRPTAYIERHASGQLNRKQALDSNWLLAPTYMVQTYAEANSTNALTSIHARTVSLTAAGNPPTADTSDGVTTQAGINASVNLLCAYTGTVVLAAPSGSANRAGWAANYEVYWNSGNNPVNLVGVEVDIINTAGPASGQLPGILDNFTGFWAQTASRNAYPSTCGFLVTDAGLSAGGFVSGWQYGMAMLSRFYQWALYIDNRMAYQSGAAAAQGAYINIASAVPTSNILVAASQGTSRFIVSADTNNPVYIMCGGVLKQVMMGNSNTGPNGSGRALYVSN